MRLAIATNHGELVDSLEREWRDALCAKDIDRLRTLVHPKFTVIGTGAAGPFTLGRDEYLEAIQKRDPLGIEIEIKDALVLDKVIVGTVEARWKVSYLNQTFDDCVLVTDVWVFDNDRWSVVRRHLSPVPPANCAAGKH